MFRVIRYDGDSLILFTYFATGVKYDPHCGTLTGRYHLILRINCCATAAGLDLSDVKINTGIPDRQFTERMMKRGL